MKKENEEFKQFSSLRHKTSKNDDYFLTIIDDDGLRTINLKQQNKNKLTFGKSPTNDIVLSSEIVDYNQGYLELTEYGVLIVNTSEDFKIVGNNNKEFSNFYLAEGGFAKIVDANSPLSAGVLMIMSIGENMDEWKTSSLTFGPNTIGSSSSCNVVLPSTGVAKKHATINYLKNKISIKDEHSLNGVFINGIKISPEGYTALNNLDVILICNSKIILCNDKLIYQISGRGIRLDAININRFVRIKFKKRQISTNVNMTVKPSEFVAFVGGSGAGKTTFMKCISGVDRPTSGTVLLNGENLYENYENLKSNIGYVPQKDIVYSNLTLFDMLKYAAKLRMPDSSTKKDRMERIQSVLEIVQLTGFENSYIRQLSGGQKKRASIAVELLADPNILFLDEPTSGLDPDTERSLMQTLQKMARMGKTIILVTHNTLNLHLCDKVAFFGYGGHLCFYGTPDEALNFFEVDDFVDIYTLIHNDMEYWYQKFESTRDDVTQNVSTGKTNNNLVPQKKSFIKQTIILTKRYIKLILNDVQQLILLFAQAPILACLLALISNSDLYSTYDDTKAIFFSISCASIWLGLLNSIQEICKEKVILQKEHMSNLKLPAYLLSKFIVQGMLAFIQSTLMILIFQSFVGQSSHSVIFGPFWEIQIISFLSILCAASLGLFISSLVKDSNIALSLIPLILVPQLLFSGMLFKLKDFTKFLSNFILSRWSVEGFGTSTNLNDLTHLAQTFNPLIEIEPESYFTYTSEHMIKVILIISLMTIVLMIGSYFALKKTINKNM